MQKYIVEVYSDRTEWKNDQGHLHRLDGPAIEYSNGYKAWYVNEQRHRIDGPAIEHSDGRRKYFLEGKEMTRDEYIMVQFLKGIVIVD